MFIPRHKVEPKVSEPGVISDEETEEGDFTVYECPGLAPVRKKKKKVPSLAFGHVGL